MSAYTRGPWSVEQIGVTDMGPDGDDVFDIGPCDKEGAMRVRVATVAGDDAHLVAAAPDLLIACEAALHDRMFKDWPEVATLLKNAIAKAKGEA